MKFKKMEINGFKSFADKIEIKFGNGVTGIVGPNGCGKSNVADSIRFALGEQSSKTLRGGNMQDVIFNGTEKRKSQSFCEVSMYFDNSERIFRDLNYDEVVFTRKLFRSNESEYMINKTPCRRADIIDALRDSGVGKEGYSIIGQGKIDELISSKPEDRRNIFDEAAGISKFKAKKTEAERRLVRTRDSLARIGDILEEKSKQLAPLTRQAQTARKYLELAEQLKHYEINIYLHQYETTTDTKKTITDRRNAIADEMERCRRDRDAASDNYNKAMTEFGNIDKTIEAHHDELVNLTSEVERNNSEVSLRNNDIRHIMERNEELLSEIAKYESDIRAAEALINAGLAGRDEKTADLARMKTECDGMSAQTDELENKLSAMEGEEKEGQRALVAAIEKLTDIKANMSKLLAERDGLEKQIAALKTRLSQSASANAARKNTADAVRRELETAKASREEQDKILSADTAKSNENLARLTLNNNRLKDINAKYYSLAERKDVFTKFSKENAGFERSVSRLLEAAKTDTELSSRIEGVIAKIIKVPKNYETAVEMALGGAVQNIVTKTEDEARYIIEYLKSKNFGRVTFLPMNVIRPRYIHDDLKRHLDVKGCHGAASSLVSYDPKFDGIVKYLLGTTVIVDDLNTGISIARASRYAFRIVTLDGDVINPHGAITGGSKKADVANVFAYDRELREIEELLAAERDKVKALEDEHNKITREQEALSLSIKSRSSAIHALDVKIAAQEQQYNKYLGEIEDIDRENGESEAQLLAWQVRADEISNDLNSVGALEELIQSQKTDAATSNLQSENEIVELKKQRDALREKLTALKIDCANLENEISNMDRDVAHLKDNIDRYNAQIGMARMQIESNEKDIAQKKADLEKLMLTVGENDSQRVAALKKKIADFGEYKQRIQSDMNAYEAERDRLVQLYTELSEKKNEEELKLQKVDIDLEQMQQRIAEVYKLEYADCLPLRDPEFEIEPGIEEAARLKRRIDNLGHINLEAIEQCETVYAEYSELEKQRDDLTAAERDLVKVITDLSKEMKTTFNEKFAQINENFKVIFRELFNGGTAELILLEPEEGKDELSAGVEIKAQPPQKKLQLLSLLSGGEKAMTAIAILFAILKLRPMPFCVLDEIEAALDDANVLRFAKYLKRYSQDTQFIVITHRKPTMELADALYGVTMEEKGVSKIVSVKLSDAVKLAM